MDYDKADLKEKTVSNAYLELQRLGQNGEYDRALKVTNRILQLSPQDEKTFHCKIVCLVHLSKFNEVLQLMQRQPALSKDLHFEKAYCQYRLNQSEEALATIEQAEQTYRVKELKAQILYRMESFNDCLAIYRDVIKNTHDEYSDERETNLTAVVAQLQHMNIKNDMVKLRSDTYELCYNWACILIAKGRYAEAEKKLKQCEKLCRGSLEEDGASEDEIEIELALLKIQLAYVYQKQGQMKEAYQMYTAALKLKLDDSALIAVVCNNIVSINKDENVFDSKKKMKAATSDGLIHKLPSAQRRQIALNNAILMYYTNNFDLCNKSCERVEEAWPSITLQARITHALSLTKSNSHSKAIALLNNYDPKSNEEKLYVKLVIVHLLLTQGEQAEACKVLESMGADSYKPAIVGALITLYLGMKKKDTALKVFEKAVGWYKTNKIKADLRSMWRQAAHMHMRNGQAMVAANSLEELVRSNPADQKSIAHLALAYLQFDKKMAATLINKFPKPDKKLSQREIDALESASWITLKKTAHNKPEQSPGTPKAELNKVKNKKKRKPKLPKNYDPNVIPDPERWLPKYERTGYRKRRDRRAKEVIKGSQGTTSAQADQYDFSKIVEDTQKSPPVSSVEPSPQPKSRQKKVQQNKKKNKRR